MSFTKEKMQTSNVENWESFQARISNFSEPYKRQLNRAYQFSKYAHRDQKREGGERYFEHPRAVLLILMDECKIKDPEILIPALLHDVAEDTALFGNPIKVAYSRWRDEALETLTLNFGKTIANIVLALSKPGVDNIEIFDKAQSAKMYLEGLKEIGEKAIIVKMADRLHNLRTLSFSSEEKIQKQIIETRTVYYPLFELCKKSYPEETKYLIDQMETAMKNLER